MPSMMASGWVVKTLVLFSTVYRPKFTKKKLCMRGTDDILLHSGDIHNHQVTHEIAEILMTFGP